MTLEESLSRYEHLTNRLSRALDFTSRFELNTNIFRPWVEEMLANSVQTYYTPACQALLKPVSSWLTFLQTDTFASSLDALDRLSNIAVPPLLDEIELSCELAERISAIISVADCYIPEELHQECVEAVPDIPQEKRKTFLTFDRAIALLGLLIALYTGIVAQMPNPQLTEISEQNERIIAIEEDRLELERQQAEILEEIANNLRDVIVDLNDQIEAQVERPDILGDLTEDTDDLDVLPSQASEADRQEDNADAKD